MPTEENKADEIIANPEQHMKKKVEGIPFRQFLNESTNLLTCFGIFHALSSCKTIKVTNLV